jgi:hypothetical protein
MDGQSLDGMIQDIIERYIDSGGSPEDEGAAFDAVIQDPAIRILLDGYDLHDRSEGLESVIERDIRRKVGSTLQAYRDGKPE